MFAIIADGFEMWLDGFDNQIYTVGRGPSATTVQAPQTAITAGNNVVIQGTVMDISAGTTQTAQAADFPNGVPFASDASMSQWMSYVYQQQAEPINFTGVPVSIDAIDPNGNYIHIGDATTLASGLFGYEWHDSKHPRQIHCYRNFRWHQRLLGIKRTNYDDRTTSTFCNCCTYTYSDICR